MCKSSGALADTFSLLELLSVLSVPSLLESLKESQIAQFSTTILSKPCVLV